MNKLVENIKTIVSNPTSLIVFAAVLILVIAFMKVRKVKLTTKIMTQIGLVIALSTVLSFFKFVAFANGGSVTLGSMIPIIVLALIYGPEIGFLTGFLFGFINLLVDPQVYYPVQVLFDYPFAYMCLGLAGFCKNRKYIAPVLAIGGRFIFHYLSGVIFFGSYAPEGQSKYLYSLIYNGSYLIPELIIALVIIAILPISRIYKAINTSY